MKILFLTLKTFSATGGIEKFNRCFAMALWQNALQCGWEIEVLSAYDNETDAAYLPSLFFKGFKGQKKPFSLQVIKSVREADIIITGHINLSSLVLAGQLLYPQKKWVLIAHGREVWTGLSYLQRKTIQRFDRILSVSRFTSGILINKQQVSESCTRLFPNTLDPYFAKQGITLSVHQLRQRYGIKEGQPIILTVTRLANTEKNKGCDEVLRALPNVLKKYPGLRYVLCGKADAIEKKRLLLMISELNLQNVVILAGFIENSELPTHYSMASVFAMPSRKEGFGIVFIEAAWWGLPVIAGNQDGSVDAVLDGKLGLLINPTDTAALETALLHTLSAPASSLEKEAKRKLVEENFGFDKFRERQKNALLEVIS